MGGCSEFDVLNRIVRWVVGKTGERDRSEMEVDARHVPISSFGLDSKSRSEASPGIRLVEPCGALDENRRTTYRSAAIRLASLSHDRPQWDFATKQIVRSMQTPDEASWMACEPRRVVRRCKKAPLSYLDVWTDSDQAGCTKARRSTTQTVVVLSSESQSATRS